MQKLRINGFKADAHIMQCIFAALSIKVRWRPQEKFYRIFTAMLVIVAHDLNSYDGCSCL